MQPTSPPADPVRCRPLAAADVGPASRQMAAAFEVDPAMRYLFPDAARRPGRLAWLMTSFLRLGLLYGQVQVAGTPPVGAAVWFAPGRGEPSAYRLLRGGWAALPLRLGWRAMGRFLRLVRAVEHERHRLMREPHWYLLTISVNPNRHGQGIGGRLLRAVIDSAAAAGHKPGYLETFNPANLPFYERHGFKLLHESRQLHPDLPFWCFARVIPPAPRAGLVCLPTSRRCLP